MPRSPRRLFVRPAAWLVGCALTCASLAPASAQTPPPAGKARKDKPLSDEQKRAKAREAYASGEAKASAKDYAGALDDYRTANELVPSPQARFKVASMLDALGKGGEAVAAYQAFLAEPPPDNLAEQKAAASARLEALQQGVVKVTTTPAGASVSVDGVAQAEPSPLTLKLKPGKHTLALTAPDTEPKSVDVDVAAGQNAEVSVTLTSNAPSTVASAPPPPPVAASFAGDAQASKVPAYVTLGLGGAGLVVGTIFGVKALSSRSDFDKSPSSSRADDAERNALIADMAFGVAATLGVTGAVLLFSNNSPAPTTAPATRAGSLRLAPLVTSQSKGAAAVFRF